MNKAKPVIAAALLLGVFLSISLWLIMQYLASERERDMFYWQDRLSILAESQKRSIEDWLDGQLKNLNELAENPLTQIFVSMEKGVQEQTEAERGQAAHLRNLLVATAKRSGLYSTPEKLTSNLARPGGDGIALLDTRSRILVSTRGFPKIDDHINRAIALAGRNQRASVYGIYSNQYHNPRMVIAVPVSRVQSVTGSGDFSGYVVAVINPEFSLYSLLAGQWLTSSTDETLLVGGDDNSTVYLSPLQGDYRLFHRVSVSTEQLAANFARAKTGGFAQKLDYSGKDVLVTGRTIDNTSWILVQKIDASEALRESAAYRDFVHTVFLLAVFVVAVGFIAIWRHATSVRLQKTSESLAARTVLLNAVGDNIRDHIFLLGADEKVVYINKALAGSVGVQNDEVIGKSLHHIFSMDTAESLLGLKAPGLSGDAGSRVMRLKVADSEHDYHVSLASLTQGGFEDSLLYVLHDITELKEAQGRHSRLLEGIIATLVHAVDMHDPHCAHHSERTRDVAVAIARALGLSTGRTSSLSMAALLSSIGKLYVPREILTRDGPLTEEEENTLKQHVLHTVEILKGLDFDGPVVEIIGQKNERVDGKGYPSGLDGDGIMQEAKILAVANAFVAMSSARAYRPGMPVGEVMDKLLEQADQAFDRHVVAALFHIAENRTDWKNWQAVEMS